MKYELPDNLSHEAAEALATGGDATALSKALVSLSLNDPDLRWTSDFLRRLAHHSNPNVRGNALLGLGHLARRFRTLPDRDAAAAAGIGQARLHDAFVRGQADSADDDLASLSRDMKALCPVGGVVCLLSLLAVTGCGSGSSLPERSEEAGVDGGADAATTTDAAHDDASSDAGCAPLPKSPCAVDSDCPAPKPPQNLKSYCCGAIARGPGNCQALSLPQTTCIHADCGGGSLECTASTGTAGLQHMCGSPSDCLATGQQCCTVCQGGYAVSICMSTANATELGARCL